ncbi:hypothetical protein TRVL_00147 [Trypanosoma vivax]|nr:hypothetical protein TRVL_00147 [Trypanosoma vivax]
MFRFLPYFAHLIVMSVVLFSVTAVLSLRVVCLLVSREGDVQTFQVPLLSHFPSKFLTLKALRVCVCVCVDRAFLFLRSEPLPPSDVIEERNTKLLLRPEGCREKSSEVACLLVCFLPRRHVDHLQ